MVHIIIKGEAENRKRLKGRGISELAKNLESEGWPSEFVDDGERDRVKWLEKKLGRPATEKDMARSKLFPKKPRMDKFFQDKKK